jgi:AraC family transcriptional regulator
VRAPSRRPRAGVAPVPIDPVKLRRVVAHIHSNLDQELDVASLAKLAGASASCFARAFRQHVGVAPHAYVLDLRVERAKELLAATELSLAAIALEVGFTSQSCLNVAFRRRAGTTPGRFRTNFSRKAKDARRGRA